MCATVKLKHKNKSNDRDQSMLLIARHERQDTKSIITAKKKLGHKN